MRDNVAALWADYAPRIAEARQSDAAAQDEAFLSLGQMIHDRPIVPLSVEKFLLLELTENHLIVEGDPRPEDVANFLWIMSPDFVPDPKKAKRALRRFPTRKWVVYLTAIQEFLGKIAALSQGKKETSPKAWVSGVVDMFASQYNWRVSEILSLPMAQLFQLAARMRQRLSQTNVTFSPRADALQAEFMDKANALKQ